MNQDDTKSTNENHKIIAPLVIEDMAKRFTMGMKKYGRPVYTFNGRDALQDAYEEVLDLAVYLKQKLMEQKIEADYPQMFASGYREDEGTLHNHLIDGNSYITCIQCQANHEKFEADRQKNLEDQMEGNTQRKAPPSKSGVYSPGEIGAESPTRSDT